MEENEKLKYIFSIDYIENEKIIFEEYNTNSNSLVTTELFTKAYKDLNKGELTLASYSYTKNFNGSTFAINSYTIIDSNETSYYCGKNGYFVLYDEDGYDYFILNDNNTVQIPLYYLNGWSEVSGLDSYDDKVEVTINDIKYDQNPKSLDDKITYYFSERALGNFNYLEPILVLQLPEGDISIDMIKKSLEDLGLSYKKDKWDDIQYYILNSSNINNSRNAFGVNKFIEIPQLEIRSFFYGYTLFEFSFDYTKNLLKEKFTYFQEQSKSEDIFSVIPSSFEGEVIGNEDCSINGNGASIILKPNIFLEKEEKYKAVMMLKGENDYYKIMESNTCIYNRIDDMKFTFTGLNDQIISYMQVGEKYQIVAFVINENGTRVSTINYINPFKGFNNHLAYTSNITHKFETNEDISFDQNVYLNSFGDSFSLSMEYVK